MLIQTTPKNDVKWFGHANVLLSESGKPSFFGKICDNSSQKKTENGQMFRLKRSSAIDGSKYFCTTPLNAGKQRLPSNAKQSQNESPEWLIVTKKHDGKTQKWTEGLKSSSSTPLTFTIWHSDEKTWRANTGIWWDMMDRFQVKLTRNCKVWLYRSHRTAGKGSWQIDVLLTNQTRESSNFVYCAGKKIHFRL